MLGTVVVSGQGMVSSDNVESSDIAESSAMAEDCAMVRSYVVVKDLDDDEASSVKRRWFEDCEDGGHGNAWRKETAWQLR